MTFIGAFRSVSPETVIGADWPMPVGAFTVSEAKAPAPVEKVTDVVASSSVAAFGRDSACASIAPTLSAVNSTTVAGRTSAFDSTMSPSVSKKRSSVSPPVKTPDAPASSAVIVVLAVEVTVPSAMVSISVTDTVSPEKVAVAPLPASAKSFIALSSVMSPIAVKLLLAEASMTPLCVIAPPDVTVALVAVTPPISVASASTMTTVLAAAILSVVSALTEPKALPATFSVIEPPPVMKSALFVTVSDDACVIAPPERRVSVA